MRICECLAHVPNDGERIGSRQRAAVSGGQQLAEQRSAEELHGEKIDAAVAVELVDPHNIRMRKQLQVLELALLLRGAQHLERHAQVRAGQIETVVVGRFEHRAAPAATQFGDEPIATSQQVADRSSTSGAAQCVLRPEARRGARRGARRRSRRRTRCRTGIGRLRARSGGRVFLGSESGYFEARFDGLEHLGFDLAAPEILIEEGQHFPIPIAAGLEPIVHRPRKTVRIAAAAGQRVQPLASRVFTAGLRRRPNRRL
jgi:hypothetical protein